MSGSRPVVLKTANGRFVANLVVAPGSLPGIIQWGSRYFVNRDGLEYVEAVLWTAPGTETPE